MVDLQKYLPPVDYDALLSGEYKQQQLAELGGNRGPIPLLTDMTLEKRDKAQKPEFPYYRNIYWGDLKEIEDCGLWNFREKQLVPKALYPMSNAIFMQHVFPEMCNYNIKSTGQYSCVVNDCLTIEIHIGDPLKQDGAVIGILKKQKPTPEIAPYLPNWDKDYDKFCEKTYIKDMKAEAE